MSWRRGLGELALAFYLRLGDSFKARVVSDREEWEEGG
jgi:hypothetical protein